MPHLATINLIGRGVDCNMTANRGHQELIIELLKEKIGTLIPKRQQTRVRRFLATMILGGTVAWNRASIWSLKDTISSLDRQMQSLKDNNQIVTNSVNTLIDNQHAIHHAVDRQARILREFMSKSTCDEMITNYFREVYSTWLSLAPNDFARVVDSALSGKITPDLLPATDVLSVLLKHPAIASTAYSADMTLLYELGKFSLHQVNYDPYPMVSGMMIFPRILMDRSAALMHVHTTHSTTQGGFRKLQLPDVVACKTRGDCWEISPTACRETLTLTLCPKTTKVEFNSCIEQIMENKKQATSCEWKLSSEPRTEVITFDGGVLISASTMKGEIMVTQGKELIVHKQVDPSPDPTILTSSDGDYLHIGGQIYQLSQETLKTGYEILINLTAPAQRETIEDLTVEGWVSESKVPQLRSIPWAPPDHYTWWALISTIVMLLALAGVIIRYRFTLSKLRNKVKSEISGWINVPSAPPAYRSPPPKTTHFTDIAV